jgi:hypothetical protein
MSIAPDYYRAFAPSVEFSNELGTFRCVTRQIATLVLPDGRIVAGDPLVDLSPTPFARVAPGGEHPVLIALARLDSVEGVDERIACAMVRFSDAAPRSWVMATQETQDPTTLKQGEIFGYGVDSGMGCFASVEAATALRRRMEVDEAYADHVIEEAGKVYVHTRDWASVVPDPASRFNVVIFSSGLGDGFYASYWGCDDAGSPVCLITDFGLVGQDPDDSAGPVPDDSPGVLQRVVNKLHRWFRT